MIRVALLGLVSSVLAIVAGMVKREYSLLIGICGAVIICIYGTGQLSLVLGRFQDFLSETGSFGPYMQIMLKMAGIAYVSQFTAGLCREAGYLSIGNQISMFGKISILLCSFPILQTLFETMGKLWET